MIQFRRTWHKAGVLIRSTKCFYFLCGLFLGFILYIYTEDKYEKQLFGALANNIRMQSGIHSENADTIVVMAVHLVHVLEQSRQSIFPDLQLGGFKAGYLQPITCDLMTGKGACGSNSLVLSRVLMEFGYPVRIAQMKVDGRY